MLSVRAIRYRRERWVTPDGRTIVAPLLAGTKRHFGANLRRFVLMQYHQGQTTLPRLTALSQSVGVSISQRAIQRLLTERQDGFRDEARDVLRAGVQTLPWVSVDWFAKRAAVPEGVCRADTGARHNAKYGFWTPCLAWPRPAPSTASRSGATRAASSACPASRPFRLYQI